MVFKESSITTKLLKRVFQHTNLNKQQFFKEIIESMLRVMADSSKDCNVKEENKFVDYMTDQMVNMANRFIKENNKVIDFLPRLSELVCQYGNDVKVRINKFWNQMHACSFSYTAGKSKEGK